MAANTFTEPGYTFAGWSDGNATYAAGATYTLASNGSAIVLDRHLDGQRHRHRHLQLRGWQHGELAERPPRHHDHLAERSQPCRLRFAGWFAAPSGGSALTSPYTLAGSVTLYAQWTANATDTVTFNSEGGSTVSSQSGLQGTTITLPSAPSRAGYVFNGWFAAPSGGSALTSPYTLAGSVTLYAQWTANATDTVTFNSEGGSHGELAERPPRHHDHLAERSQPCRLRFNGWFAAPSGGSALTSPYTLAASVTLYAQWTANATDTVTFNSEGGSTVSSLSGLQGTTITLPSAPSRAGYASPAGSPLRAGAVR